MIVVLRGPIAVGKSTIARIIQKKLGINWTVLNVDEFKYYMPLKKGDTNRSERSEIAHTVSKYFAREMYLKGYDVIMEEMYKKPYNDSLVEFLRQNGMEFIKVFLSAPVETVVARSKAREKNIAANEVRRHYTLIEPTPMTLWLIRHNIPAKKRPI